MAINKDVLALERYRKKKGISIYKICKILAVSKMSYRRWVHGDTEPLPIYLKKIQGLLAATISKRIEINPEQEKLFFDWLVWRRDIVFAFHPVPSLEKLMGQGDKTGMIHSFFKTSDIRKLMPELDDDGIYSLLDDLSNQGKIKIFYVNCEPESFIHDVSFRAELGQAVKTISVMCDYEAMRFSESYLHPRLYKDIPLTEKERQAPEVIKNVKEQVELALKDGLKRIASRHPRTREMEIEKELRREERDHKLAIDRALLKITEDKK